MNTDRTVGTCRCAAERYRLIFSGFNWINWPFLALVALLCLVCGSASYPFLVPDEARHAGIVHDMWAARRYLVPGINGFPTLDGAPLHYWVSLAFLTVLGPYEWVLRLPSALAAVALLVFIGRVFLPALKGRGAGRLTVLFLIQPALLLGARFASPDMLSLLLLTLALGGFLRAVQDYEQGRRSVWPVYGAWLATALLGLSSGALAVLLPVLVVLVWLFLRQRYELIVSLRLGTGGLLAALLLVPWFLYIEARYPGMVAAILHKQAWCLVSGGRNGWAEIDHGICALLVLAGSLPLLACLVPCRRPAFLSAVRTPEAGLMAVWLLLLIPLHVLMALSPVGHAMALVVPLLYFGTLAMQSEENTSFGLKVRAWLLPLLASAALGGVGIQFLSQQLSSTKPVAQALIQHYSLITDKAIMLDRYDYDFNFHMRSPKLVYVATDWEAAGDASTSFWKQRFLESARFVPETATRMLLDADTGQIAFAGDETRMGKGSAEELKPHELLARLCERRLVNLWVIGPSDASDRHPILDSFGVWIDTGEVRVWYLSAGREPRHCVAWAMQSPE